MIGRCAGWVVLLAMLLGSVAMAASAADESPQYTVDNPRWDSLGSPRETMFTFLEAANHVLEGRGQAMPRVRKTFAHSEHYSYDELLHITDQLMGVLDRLGRRHQSKHQPMGVFPRQGPAIRMGMGQAP